VPPGLQAPVAVLAPALVEPGACPAAQSLKDIGPRGQAQGARPWALHKCQAGDNPGSQAICGRTTPHTPKSDAGTRFGNKSDWLGFLSGKSTNNYELIAPPRPSQKLPKRVFTVKTGHKIKKWSAPPRTAKNRQSKQKVISWYICARKPPSETISHGCWPWAPTQELGLTARWSRLSGRGLGQAFGPGSLDLWRRARFHVTRPWGLGPRGGVAGPRAGGGV